MMRLHVLVEGHSEVLFVRQQLAPHLLRCGLDVRGHPLTTSTDAKHGKVYKGGLSSYVKSKRELLSLMKMQAGNDVRFSTMFDLYALPADFPGYASAAKQATGVAKAKHLEEALAADINHWRFVPYIQLHEFEALLLAEPARFDAHYLDAPAAVRELVAEIGARLPEDINDGLDTAPSKRIIAHFPRYKGEKVDASSQIAAAIGLRRMKDRCPHFNQWLAKLEALGATDAP